MTIYETNWHELADIKDELAVRDWFMGTSGNLSIRVDEGSFLVTASGLDKRKRTDNDFLLVDLWGKPLEDTSAKPSAETLLHCEIYQKTAAGASLHVHTVANNVISEIFYKERAVTFKHQELIKAFGLWGEDDILTIPIIRNDADIPTLTEHFSPFITADKGAVLIHNHGITVWGNDGFEAKKLLEACEFLFQYKLSLIQLKGGIFHGHY